MAFAKTMTDKPMKGLPRSTEPRFEKEAMEAVHWMSRLPAEALEEVLKVNGKIAAETALRYELLERGEAELLPSLLSYSGIVFKRIGAKDFTRDDWEFAQQHLRIVSALYGMLRPLDRVGAYRMEGWVRLPDMTGSPKGMYTSDSGDGMLSRFEKWRKLLTDDFIDEIKGAGGVLMHLASEEMQQFVDWEALCRQVRVIKPDFYEIRDGKLKNVTIYAKMCRGEMIRYIVQNRVDEPEEVKAFTWNGFRFSPVHSQGDRWIFVR